VTGLATSRSIALCAVWQRFAAVKGFSTRRSRAVAAPNSANGVMKPGIVTKFAWYFCLGFSATQGNSSALVVVIGPEGA
jgi:hypothetical protein